MLTHNAWIDFGNSTGDIAKGVIDLFSNGTFPSAETQLDNTTQPIQLNLGSTLSSLATGCDIARQQGFTQFDTPIDTSQVLDSASDQILGGGGAGSAASFTAQIVLPHGESGDHSLIGVEKVAGKTVQATDNIFIEPIPR